LHMFAETYRPLFALPLQDFIIAAISAVLLPLMRVACARTPRAECRQARRLKLEVDPGKERTMTRFTCCRVLTTAALLVSLSATASATTLVIQPSSQDAYVTQQQPNHVFG